MGGQKYLGIVLIKYYIQKVYAKNVICDYITNKTIKKGKIS